MASLAKVLRKAGYLNPVALTLQKFIDKQNQRSNQAQFNELMQTAVGEIMKSGTEQTEAPPTFTPGNRLGEDLSQTPVDPRQSRHLTTRYPGIRSSAGALPGR